MDTRHKKLLLNLELRKIEVSDAKDSSDLNPLPVIPFPEDKDTIYRVGAILKWFRDQGYYAFTIQDLMLADPTIEHATYRATILKLIKARLVRIGKETTIGRGKVTIYTLVRRR